MKPDELAKLFGPYAKPTPFKTRQVRLTVNAAGGSPLPEDDICRSARIDYRSDPEGLQEMRNEPIGPNYTCSCGRIGVRVRLDNPRFSTEPVGAPLRGGTSATACIYCDGVHLMPKFKPKTPPRTIQPPPDWR